MRNEQPTGSELNSDHSALRTLVIGSVASVVAFGIAMGGELIAVGLRHRRELRGDGIYQVVSMYKGSSARQEIDEIQSVETLEPID